MATGTPGTVARTLHTQQTHYLRKLVNFNDAGIAAGVLVGTVPAGAIIIDAQVLVTTVFNAATTNNLLVGTTAGGSNVFAAADSAAGVLGLKRLVSATIGVAALVAVDQAIYVAFTQTGAAATTGVAYVVVEYVVNNDK